MKFDEIKEVESKLEDEDEGQRKLEKFEDLLKKYGAKSDQRKYSVNEEPVQNRPKNNTVHPK